MSAIALHKEQKRKFSDEYFEGKQAEVSPLKQTGEGLLRDITIGVIGGGLASAILGRYSFVLGLGIAGYGHYSQNRMLSSLGFGMMASGTFHALTGRDQKDKPVGEKITERLEAFKSEVKRKLWLDYFEEKKGKPKQTKDETTEELNGTAFDHYEQFAGVPEAKAQNYFQIEKIAPVNVEDYPEMNPQEHAFVEQRVDQLINREMKLFYENRQAVASYLKTGEVPAKKAETKKQEAVLQPTKSRSETPVRESQQNSGSKKSSSTVKADPYPDYEPEPQELIF